MPVSIGGSENPGNRICAIFLPPQYSCELYDSGLERYRTLKKQSKKTRMLQSMHSQLFVVLLYHPPAGSGCCRISCRYSLVLQKMPGIDGAGSQYKTNRRAPAVARYPTGSPRCTGKWCQPAGFGRCRIACWYPSAEFGWCQIVYRHLSRLRIIPGIENSARLPLFINFMTGWQE